MQTKLFLLFRVFKQRVKVFSVIENLSLKMPLLLNFRITFCLRRYHQHIVFEEENFFDHAKVTKKVLNSFTYSKGQRRLISHFFNNFSKRSLISIFFRNTFGKLNFKPPSIISKR